MWLYCRLQNITLAAPIGLAYAELVSICSRAFFSNKEQTPTLQITQSLKKFSETRQASKLISSLIPQEGTRGHYMAISIASTGVTDRTEAAKQPAKKSAKGFATDTDVAAKKFILDLGIWVLYLSILCPGWGPSC